MTANANNTLLQLEEKIAKGEMKTFTVLIRQPGLLISTTGGGLPQEVPLSQELQQTIQTYFFGVKSIPFGSYDYTTLKSLINARECLERMRKDSAQ